MSSLFFENNKKIKVVFMGTPEIAINALKGLINRGFNVVAVVTQPDRPIGRKKIIEQTPIKKEALKLNIKIFQPEKIIDIRTELEKLKPDLFVTCAYGQFLPSSILNIPKIGCINAHASLLPKYRGGAPIHWALINGEKYTGVTLMKTIKEMDAGDMYISYRFSIDEDDNLKTLFKKVGKCIYLIIFNELENIINNKLSPIKQINDNATFAYNIEKDKEKINVNDFAINIRNLVRGLYENPSSYLIYEEKNIKVKIYEIILTNEICYEEPGFIKEISKNGIKISTKDFYILIIDFKIEGKNRQNIKDFYLGNRIFKINKKFI